MSTPEAGPADLAEQGRLGEPAGDGRPAEADPADAAEQSAAAVPDDEPLGAVEAPLEADPADVAEQLVPVPVDEQEQPG